MLQGQLLKHLEGLREYMLLGNGEFFHVFIEQSSRMLSSAPSPHRAESDINAGPFQQVRRESENQLTVMD